MKEYAEEGHERRGGRAMVEAMRALKRLRPPCWRIGSHGIATRIVTIDGELHAVCGDCARNLRLDQRVARQREDRARMRGQ